MQNYFPSDYRIIAKLIGADFNVTTDQLLPLQISDSDSLISADAGDFIVDSIIVTNASTSLTTAAGGIYTAASKGGSVVVAAAQVYSALTAATKYVALTRATSATVDVYNQANLYFSLTTPQGAAATADIYVYGRLFQKR